jgi:hypothetical protein
LSEFVRAGSHALGADDGEKLQLGGAFGAGWCAEPQQTPASVLAEQAVAVQLDDAQRGVHEAFVVGPPEGDVEEKRTTMPFANFKVPAGTLDEKQKEKIVTRTTEL